MSTSPTMLNVASSPSTMTIPNQPTASNTGPQLNRKQRRKLEKKVRSAGFRRRVRHVMANRKREALAITQEALEYAANGPLDINLEAE